MAPTSTDSKTYLVIIILFLLGAILSNSACIKETGIFKRIAEKEDARMTKNAEEAIRDIPAVAELDRLCRSFPLLDTFEITKKQVSRKNHLQLFYNYSSNESFAKMSVLYRETLTKDGWELLEDGSDAASHFFAYKKDRHRVKVYRAKYPEGLYSVVCEDLAN